MMTDGLHHSAERGLGEAGAGSTDASEVRLRGWRHAMRRRLSTAWRPHRLYLGGSPGTRQDVSAGVAAFARWCQANEGAVCQIALSGRWVLCAAHAPCEGPGAMQAEAVRRWAHYHDVDEATLTAQWLCRAVADDGIGLAMAVPRPLVEGLSAAAREHGVHLRSVRVWWLRGLAAWLNHRGQAISAEGPVTLKVIEPGLVTHLEVGAAAGGRSRVHAVWSEPASSHLADGLPASPVLRLPTPPFGEDARALADAALAGPDIWGQAQLSDVLGGRLQAWQEAA